EKLERVRDSLGVDWPLVVADVSDEASLAAMAGDARVVATTVGPYWPAGLKLVDACVQAGTHYLDLTGEILFAHATIERHERARSKIVLSCGFDSIPSDLGVLLLHEQAGELGDTTLVVKSLRGGFSGGTLASLKGQIDELRRDRSARRIMADPNALAPGREVAEGRDLRRVARHPQFGWVGPFVMATYNTRVVRRSALLLDYGPRFRYHELSAYGNPVTATLATAGLGTLAGGLALPPTRQLLDRVLPDPGQGPSESARERGSFAMEVHGAGHVATVAAKGDPGYKATAVMMGESALCLALDDLPDRSGVLTPASAMGSALVERLRAAGLTLRANKV
ncbi:MAG TPA: enoyl-ACP reductase, partial [Solirubrobacter sp.]|nr:enoyl-ACP reductase [Solirubrobacter sp.]